ncbi:MAG: PKD domain-containing protein [Planctomycetota bacterium]|nr:PKD domain-containing protein [Planctomycetota bacterium]
MRRIAIIAGLLASGVALPVGAEDYVFSTFAGSSGKPGWNDGIGCAARFNAPQGLAVDPSGNIYVADADNNTIRMMNAAGQVITVAGRAGFAGSTNGTRGAARFNSPRSVALDSSGNIYVADTYNNTIRKITPAGVVTTLAGQAGTPGSDDGTGSAARFNVPSGVAVDSGGNVYVADTGNHTVRKITPAGVVTTLAGQAGAPGSDDGTGSAARFNLPSGMVVDATGNVYVADESNHTIRKIAPNAAVTTPAGHAGEPGSVDGTGINTRFNFPAGMVVDASGTIYVADSGNHTIRRGRSVNAPNLPPVISSIPNWATSEDMPAEILFFVSDFETSAANITVTGSSSNKALVPDENISFGGFGMGRSVTITSVAEQSGTTTMTITATDSEGLSSSSVFVLAVNPVNDPPVIISGPHAAPNPAESGQEVAFSVETYDADGDQPAFSWDFGDGTGSTEKDPTHVFAAPGTYNATVTVSDGNGGTTTASVAVKVEARNLVLKKLGIAREFGGLRRLRIKAAGIGNAPEGISPADTTVGLNIAGVVVSGQMNAKGKITLDNLKFKFAPKWKKLPDGSLRSFAGPAKFKASILENDLAWEEELGAAKLEKNAGGPIPTDVEFALSIGTIHYSALCAGQWKSDAAKGKFKGPTQ